MDTDKPTILLVDDEPNIINSLKRLLRKESYTILCAHSGQEGLEILKEHTASLIISDQRMPEMCGVDFLHQVKELYPETIRVILSGYTDVNSIMAAINEGEVYKFITKPWNDEEIKLSIKRSLEQYILQKENRNLYCKISDQNKKLEEMVETLERTVGERTKDLQVRNSALLIYQNIVENLPMGIAGIDESNTIVLANNALHTLFQKAPGEMIGNTFTDIFPFSVCNALKKAIENSENLNTVFKNEEAVGGKNLHVALSYAKDIVLNGVIVLVTEMPHD